MLQLPPAAWSERTIPSLQVCDVSQNHSYQDALHALDPQAGLEHPGLLEWLNEVREPLHAVLGSRQTAIAGMLRSHNVSLETVAAAVAATTRTPAWPMSRLVLASELDEVPEYQAAVTEVTPGLRLEEHDHYLFNPLLGVVVLQDAHVENVSVETIVDTVASALGQAVSGSVVDFELQYEPVRRMRYWYGYQWQHGDDYYGQLLQRAQATKVAARTRQQLGLEMPAENVYELALSPYLLPEGFYPEAGTAVALDLLNAVSGSRNYGKMYEMMWEFATKGRPAAVRCELARRTGLATKGRLQLEDLERVVPEPEGLNVEVVELIEEACDIIPEYRPSKILRNILTET